MSNLFVEYLKKFAEDKSLDGELKSKYNREALLNSIQTVIGHEVSQLIKGVSEVSYTDIQTDIKWMLVNCLKEEIKV